MTSKFSVVFATGWALAMAPAAQAETLPVEGVYAAGEDAMAEVQLLAIDSFGGRAGERLALAIDDRLRAATIEGEPWFDITFDSSGSAGQFYFYDADGGTRPATAPIPNDGPDAVMRGSASAESRSSRMSDKVVRKCVQRDEKKNCVQEKEDRYECRQILVSFSPDVRIASRDGRRLYAKSDYLSTAESYCADSYSSPSADAMLDNLVQRFAQAVRLDLAPEHRKEGIRVLESRSGIAKADRKAFRDAIRLTKNDPYGACLAFKGFEATNPQDVSVLFNAGLCHEGEGDLDTAERLYQRAIAVAPGKDYAESGLARIASRRRAENQMAVHFGTNADETMRGDEAGPEPASDPQ